ncbi:MAG: DNA alkylation response protein, partial [bacterium]
MSETELNDSSRMEGDRFWAETHAVENVPPPLVDRNLFTSDRALCEAIAREGAGWAERDLAAFGALAGSSRMIE